MDPRACGRYSPGRGRRSPRSSSGWRWGRPCPDADAWQESQPGQLPPQLALRDQARTFSAPDLRAELDRRVEEDQRGPRALLGWRTGQSQRRAPGTARLMTTCGQLPPSVEE
jgi:hypothetical protein